MALTVFAWLIIAGGLVLWPLPIPLGIPMLIVGITILAQESMMVRNWLRRRRAANPGFNQRVRNIKPKLPKVLRHVIDITEPHEPHGPGDKQPAEGAPEHSGP